MKETFWVPVGLTVGALLLMHMPAHADGKVMAAPTGAPAKIPASDREHVYRLDLNFDTGKSDIKPGQEAVFQTLANDLKNYPYAKIAIEGHTDNVGGLEYNMKLSQQRADAVRSYLMKNYAVPGDRISAKGFAYSRPLASNDTDEGRAQNRRIMALVVRVDNIPSTGQPQKL